jgi:hypothetical protein
MFPRKNYENGEAYEANHTLGVKESWLRSEGVALCAANSDESSCDDRAKQRKGLDRQH